MWARFRLCLPPEADHRYSRLGASSGMAASALWGWFVMRLVSGAGGVRMTMENLPAEGLSYLSYLRRGLSSVQT